MCFLIDIALNEIAHKIKPEESLDNKIKYFKKIAVNNRKSGIIHARYATIAYKEKDNNVENCLIFIVCRNYNMVSPSLINT